MIKILSTKQIREADRATIEREPITSVDLMERAGTECARWIQRNYGKERPVFVFAGVGNNGGDALVIARRLIEAGYNVQTFVVRYSEKFSEDLQINLERYKSLASEINYVLEEGQFPSISSDSIIVEGLFGSGLNRAVEGLAALCIEQINASIAEVISIDLPSGLFADKKTPADAAVITASHTLTFQVPKLAFFLPGNEEYLGQWELIDIGLDPSYIANVESSLFYVNTIQSYRSFLDRSKFDHKGVFGHGLLIAGSYGKMGAAVLAAKAALRSGIGKLTAEVPHLGNNIMQIAVPEAMTIADDYDAFVGELPNLSGYRAIGVGPGLGTQKKTRRMLRNLIMQANCPLVIDADGLNILALAPEMMEMLPVNTILTPHPGEFDRMFGTSKDGYKRLELLKEKAQKTKCIIVLKGAYTAIATPKGSIYFNRTGNPGMATAGSGDVLTGVILGFLAQIKDPLIATIAAVYVHGLAGDLAAKAVGMHGMIASDIIENLGKAIAQSTNQ